MFACRRTTISETKGKGMQRGRKLHISKKKVSEWKVTNLSSKWKLALFPTVAYHPNPITTHIDRTLCEGSFIVPLLLRCLSFGSLLSPRQLIHYTVSVQRSHIPHTHSLELWLSFWMRFLNSSIYEDFSPKQEHKTNC